MKEDLRFRLRANVKQTSNDGIFKADFTVELINSDEFEIVKNPNDVADIEKKKLAMALWDGIDGILTEGQKRGHRVIDNRKKEE